MPTDKSHFTFYIKDEYLEKMKYISKQETRSLSNMLEHMCRLEIERFERENGIKNQEENSQSKHSL